ncbi:MAG: cytochrome c [Alphaproteobacteria bacterium]|nr:cytochrome c [Alphaproteobacteria bacterium]
MPAVYAPSPVTLLVVATLSLAACDDDYLLPTVDTEVVADRTDTILALSGTATDGAAVFTASCEQCHDAAGDQAKVGPALRPYMASAEDATIANLVLAGVPPSMPSFSTLLDQDVADLIAWLHDSFDP